MLYIYVVEMISNLFFWVISSRRKARKRLEREFLWYIFELWILLFAISESKAKVPIAHTEIFKDKIKKTTFAI